MTARITHEVEAGPSGPAFAGPGGRLRRWDTCQWQEAVWGPHPGCREFMDEPEVWTCGAPSYCAVQLVTTGPEGEEEELTWVCAEHEPAALDTSSPYTVSAERVCLMVRTATGRDARRSMCVRETPEGHAVVDVNGGATGDWLRRTAHDTYEEALDYYRAHGYEVVAVPGRRAAWYPWSGNVVADHPGQRPTRRWSHEEEQR